MICKIKRGKIMIWKKGKENDEIEEKTRKMMI